MDVQPSRFSQGVAPALDMLEVEKPEVYAIELGTPSTTAPSVPPSPATNTEIIEAFVERYENPAKSYATLYRKMFVYAEGIHIFDDSGKAYVDCLNGFGVNPLGHNPPVLTETLQSYLLTSPIWSAIDLQTPERVDFVETLFASLPAKLRSFKICFTGPSGSEANEMALKMARKSTCRSGIFAFRGCFHGSTITANSLTGNVGDNDLVRCAAHVHHMPFPRLQPKDCPYGRGGEESIELCLMHVQGALEDAKGGMNLPAAMIIEPVQSDGGIIPTPARFLESLRELCNKHGIIFISDEVQCGFGKTGYLFGYQRAAIVPDILVCSKAWGGGQPLSFVLYGSALKTTAPTGTWRGNQLAFKLGAAFLRELSDKHILDNVGAMEEFWLAKADCMKTTFGASIHEIRVSGGLLGLEFQSQEICKAVFDALLEADEGLLTKWGGRGYRTLIFWFALNMSQEQLRHVNKLILRALHTNCDVCFDFSPWMQAWLGFQARPCFRMILSPWAVKTCDFEFKMLSPMEEHGC